MAHVTFRHTHTTVRVQHDFFLRFSISFLCPEEIMVWRLRKLFDFAPYTSSDSLAHDDNPVFCERKWWFSYPIGESEVLQTQWFLLGWQSIAAKTLLLDLFDYCTRRDIFPLSFLPYQKEWDTARPIHQTGRHLTTCVFVTGALNRLCWHNSGTVTSRR